MKRIVLLVAMSGCGLLSFAQPGVWVQKADVGTTQSNAPITKKGAVGIAIGSKGYVCTGQNALNNITRDLQAYNPATNTWTQLAMFGGPSRSGAAGFAIGGKGYIGTGSDSTVTPWGSDFWAYDTASGAWSQVASFGGGGRQNATGFSIGNYGYLGAGNNVYGDQDDFWQYDPVANVWTKKANFGGGPRYSAVGFSIGGNGYMGTGNDPDNVQTPTFYSDFWEYDTAADTWTQKANFGGGTRSLAVGFSIGNYGYIGTGNEAITDGGVLAEGQRDLWQYDPTADTWTQKANMPAVPRWLATGFAMNNKGYIGLGYTGSCYACGNYVNDFWQYDPTADNWQSIATGFAPAPGGGAVTFSIGNKGYLGFGSVWWQYDSTADAWSQIDSFPGPERSGEAAFSIGSLGYIATGAGNGAGVIAYLSDCWQYDPGANNWTQKASIPDTGRFGAFAFAVGGKGYLGTGTGNVSDNSFLKDFWQYDPVADAWTQKADFGGGLRYQAVGMAIGGKGYAGTGEDTFTNANGNLALLYHNDFWQYDPVADTWTQKANLGGVPRIAAIGFSAGGMGYIGTGQGDTAYNGLQDFWQYDTLANTWTRIPDLPSQGRDYGAGFSLGQSGYAGSGDFLAGGTNDWWEYNATGAVIRTALGTYQVASSCPDLAGSGFTWVSDNQGALVYGVNPGGNTLGNTCWGVDILADGSYRNTSGYFGGATQAYGAYLPRNYVLTPATEPSSNVTLRFYCTAQELSDFVAAFNSTYGTGYTSADVRVIRYDGVNQDLDLTNNSSNPGDYTALTPTIGTYGSSNQYQYFEVTTPRLSEFAIALSSTTAPLGFTLLNFTATYTAPSTLLSWQTSEEENTASFQIQRSPDGSSFATIGSVAAAGNSDITRDYSYTDGTAEQAGVSPLYYRIQETDLNGSSHYSPVASVDIDGSAVFSAYPNPVTDHVFIQVSAAAASTATLMVTDVAGRKVVVEPLNLQKGNNSIYLAAGTWTPGVYFLTLNMPTGNKQVKLVKE